MAIDRNKALKSAQNIDKKKSQNSINRTKALDSARNIDDTRNKKIYGENYREKVYPQKSNTNPTATTPNTAAATTSRSAADERARKFVIDNGGEKTAYVGTGANGSTMASTIQVQSGTAGNASSSANNQNKKEDIPGFTERNKLRQSQTELEKFQNGVTHSKGSDGAYRLEEPFAEVERQNKRNVDKGNAKTVLPQMSDKELETLDKIIENDKSGNKADYSYESERIKRRYGLDSEQFEWVKTQRVTKLKEAKTTQKYADVYNNMSADAKALLSFVGEKEKETTNHQMTVALGAITGSGGVYKRNEDSLNNTLSTSEQARQLLKELYGMTDDEIDACVIFHNRSINAENASNLDSETREFADKHPFLSSTESALLSPVANMLSGVGMVRNYSEVQKAKKLGMGDIGLDTNNTFRSVTNMSNSIEDQFKKTHDWKIGNYDVGDMLYSTAMSGAKSLVSGLMGGTVGGAILGLGAATETAQELSDRGIGTDKAVVGGLVAGVFEGLFEKVSIGNFKALQETSVKGAKDFIGNIAKSMLVNASEEGATEIANIAYDTLANGGLSQYAMTVNNYTQNGKSPEVAKMLAAKDLALQVGESALSGAIMGAGFGAIGSVSGAAKYDSAMRQYGNAVKASGQTTVKIEAGKASTDSKIQKAAENIKVKKNGDVSNRQIGKLSYAIDSAIEESAISAKDNRFSDFKSVEELDGAYNETINKLNDRYGSNPAELKARKTQVTKEYNQIKNVLSMAEAAKNASDKLVKAEGRTLSEEDRFSVAHPEIDIDGEKAHIDGQTVGENNARGEFKGIFEKDGEKFTKTEDGREMKLSDAVERITDADIKELWSEAAQMSTEAANLLIENYDGQAIGEYKSAFDYYYKLGRTGMSAEQIRAKDTIFGTYLTKPAQQRIAASGLASREFRSGVTDMSVLKANKRFKYEKSVLESVGKKFNMEFIILDESSKVNGQYLTGTNRIVLYRNADANVMLRSAGHEVYHFVENYSSEQANELKSFVLEALKEKGVDVEKAIAGYERYKSEGGDMTYATRESRESELVADSMFDVFVDKKFADKLAKEDSSFAKKLTRHIGNIISEMKKAIAAFAAGKDRIEIKALSDDIATLDKIRDMLLEGLDKASENFKARMQEQKNTAGEAVDSAKDIIERRLTDKDIEEYITSGNRKNISKIEALKKGIKIILTSPNEIKNYINNALNKKVENVTVAYGRTNKKISTDANNLSKGKINIDNYYLELVPSDLLHAWEQHHKAKEIGDIDLSEIDFENIPNYLDSYDEMVYAIEYASGNKKICVSKKISNGRILIIEVVSKSRGSLQFKNAIGITESKYINEFLPQHRKSSSNSRGSNNSNNSLHDDTASNTRLSQKDTSVNTNYMQNSQEDATKKIEIRKDVDDSVQSQEFKYWFGDWQNDSENASKVVNADGTPKIMYHGSPNSFTAFDKKKAKSSGLYGKGFYFTDSESHAGQYGDKYAVYLNIKNPLEPGKNNLTKKQLMNFLEAVAENGEDYDIWNYGTENISEIADSIYKNDAFSVIQDVNATAIGDFAEAIKLFNEVNGTDYDGIITPSETVVYEPTQIKSATDNIGTFDGSNPDIRFSMKDSEYSEAVKNGDTEKAQKIVDEAAKAAGYTYKLYHQTGNDFTVFDTRHQGAGTGDSETPFGIFMKPTSNNIGLKGQKQMPVFASINNPLTVRDRGNLMFELKKDKAVKNVQDKIKEVNTDYKQRVDQAGKDLQNYLIEYRKNHPDEPRSEIYNDKGFNEIYDREESLIDEWTATIDKLSVESKSAINDYLKNNGYDGVIIEHDAGSFGRETMTYIALDNTQVKSAETVTYDNDGNLIPLSERFKDNNADIRYSSKDTNIKISDRDSEDNTLSKEQLEYFKDSKIRDENGKLLVVYHGTDADFTVFDKEKGRSNMDIQDSFFSPWELDARGYGQNVKAYYLNITNPASEGIAYKALNRFKGQNNAGIKAREYLESLGYDGVNNGNEEYIAFNSNQIKAVENQKPTSSPDILFSSKDPTEIDTYYAEVMRENRNLKQIITLLDDMQYSSARGNVHLNSSDINRIAGKILKNVSSKYDRTRLNDELTAVYDYMANNKTAGGVNTEELLGILMNVSKRILDKSEMRDTGLWEQYSEVRSFLKGQAVYITPAVKKEIESQFGDYKSFRNLLMGKMNKISTTNSEAMTLDEVWKELSGMAPEYFPEDTNELEMPMKLAAFYDSIAPKVVNPYEHYDANIEEACAVLATDIYSEFFNVGRIKTDKEKVRDILDDGMRQLAESRRNMKEDFRRKAAQNEQENYERYKTRVAEYKIQREQGDRRRRERAQIERNYNYINRRLAKETDRDHIPEKIKPLAEAFKGIIPDGTQRFSKTKFTEFENEYRKLEGVSPFFDEDMIDTISNLKDRLTNELEIPRMRDIGNSEVAALRDISEHIKHIVQGENRLFADNIKGTRDKIAQRMHGELISKPESRNQGVGENATKADKIRNGVNKFIKGLTKPEYLFEALGETGYRLYQNIRNGENVEAKIIYDAKIAEQDIKRRNNFDSRWANETVTLKLRGGNVTVTIDQAMSLYATFKRKQGIEHLINGGATFWTQKEIAKNETAYNKIRAEVSKKNKNLSDDEINKIAESKYNEEIGKNKIISKNDISHFTESDFTAIQNALTKDQKNYVNEMVEYITKEIGSKRNEVSMQLYGIEKYKEDYYFPLKVDNHFIDSQLGKQEVVSTIKNQSSSKRTVDKASNPLMISGFTQTVNQHIYDSALYCAYVTAIEDFKQVFNYREEFYEGDGVESLIAREMSIQYDIKRALGENTVDEIKRFMIALDSGSRYENLMPVSGKLASRTKKFAVMANLSVVVQQPTAVFRAMLYIQPKYFKTWATKADIEEMKQWNGCALKKEIGYFDVNMGRTATDYLNEYSTDKDIKKDWSLKDRVQNGNIMMKLDQVAGLGANKADEMTWGAIWNACKKQTKAENPELSGDNLKSKAAELFQNTISKTQVYDSVFTKPEYMRRKEGFAMMTTAFMSEPLTSLNMLADSVVKAKNAKGTEKQKQAFRFTAKAFSCYVASVVFNSAIKSVVYSLRDDDDDESFIEKYIANFTESVVSEPFQMVPYLKDIITLLQGYDLNRIDVAAFGTFKKAIETLLDDDKPTFDKIMAVLKAGGQASGIPIYNVVRDGKAIFDIFTTVTDGLKNGFEPTTGKGIINELKETFDYSSKLHLVDAEGKYDQLFNAIEDGDERHYNKVYNNLIAEGKSDSDINAQIASILAEKDIRIAEAFDATINGNAVDASNKIVELKETGFSDYVINKALKGYERNLIKSIAKNDPRAEQAAQARFNMNYEEYERLINEMVADGNNKNIVMSAVDELSPEFMVEPYEYELSDKDQYTSSYDLNNAIINGDYSKVKKVYDALSDELGEDKAYNKLRSSVIKAYQSNYISKSQAEKIIRNYYSVTDKKGKDNTEYELYWVMYEAESNTDSKFDKLDEQIESGKKIDIDYLTEHGVEKGSINQHISSKYKAKLLSLEQGSTEYIRLYNSIIEAYRAAGTSYGDAKKKIKEWHKEQNK